MPGTNYIPSRDADFALWLANFAATSNTDGFTVGLTVAQLAAIQAAATNFAAALAALTALENALEMGVVTKKTQREAAEDLVRVMRKVIVSSPNLTEALLIKFGLTVPKTGTGGAILPVSRPVLTLDFSQRLKQTVAFRNEGSAGKAKPKGVVGCQLWVKIGDAPPTGLAECTFVALDTKTPYTYDFAPADAGKIAYWFGRWANTADQFGPLSDIASGTIPAA